MLYTMPNSTLIVELAICRYLGPAYGKYFVRYYLKPMGTFMTVEDNVRIDHDIRETWVICDKKGNVLDEFDTQEPTL